MYKAISIFFHLDYIAIPLSKQNASDHINESSIDKNLIE